MSSVVQENAGVAVQDILRSAFARAGESADPEAGEDAFTRLGRRLEFAHASLEIAEELAAKHNLVSIAAHLAELRGRVKALDELIEETIRGALDN